MNLQAQPHCMSPMVVFKYKATPVSVGGSTVLGGGEEDGSDQDDDEQGIITKLFIMYSTVNSLNSGRLQTR